MQWHVAFDSEAINATQLPVAVLSQNLSLPAYLLAIEFTTANLPAPSTARGPAKLMKT